MLHHQVGPAELRDLEPWHAQEFSDMFQSEGHDLYQWLAWEHFESPDACKDFLDGFAKGRGEGSKRLFGLWLDGTLVGGTLFPTINLRSQIAEIGVFLVASARGQGIVTQAVQAMLDHAFEDLGMRRVEWRCSPANAPSRAIPVKLGFTHEGTLRQVFKVREDYLDLEVWSLLRAEWTAGSRQTTREPGLPTSRP